MAGDGAFASRGSGGLPAEGDCLSRLLGNGLEAMLMGGLHDRCARPAGRDGRRSPHPPRCAAGPAGRNGYPPGHCARRRRSGSQADRGRRAGRVARRVWCELGRTPAGGRRNAAGAGGGRGRDSPRRKGLADGCGSCPRRPKRSRPLFSRRRTRSQSPALYGAGTGQAACKACCEAGSRRSSLRRRRSRLRLRRWSSPVRSNTAMSAAPL